MPRQPKRPAKHPRRRPARPEGYELSRALAEQRAHSIEMDRAFLAFELMDYHEKMDVVFRFARIGGEPDVRFLRAVLQTIRSARS